MKPLKDTKVGKFFSNSKIGKTIVSVGLGALSATPAAAFVPSIKQAAAGLAGEGKHDLVSYISYGATIVVIILYILGHGDKVEAALGAAEVVKDIAE